MPKKIKRPNIRTKITDENITGVFIKWFNVEPAAEIYAIPILESVHQKIMIINILPGFPRNFSAIDAKLILLSIDEFISQIKSAVKSITAHADIRMILLAKSPICARSIGSASIPAPISVPIIRKILPN